MARSLQFLLVVLLASSCAGATFAQAPPAKSGGDAVTPGDLRPPQEQNADLFRRFQRELLFLAQKLKNSERPEDQERAKVIFAALKLAQTEGVDTQFQKMIAGLAKGATNQQGLDAVTGQDKQLQKALQDILNVLLTDDSATQLKNERERIEKLLAEAREVLRAQKTIRGMTEAPRVDAERIAKDQNAVTERTKDLAKKLGGEPKDGAAGKPTTPKSEGKSEAKDGDGAGEPKPDTEQAKSDAKGPQGDTPPKPGEKPDAEAGSQPKGPSAKTPDAAGQGKPSPDAKEGKPGDEAGSPRDGGEPSKSPRDDKPSKSSEGTPKAGDPKAGDPKNGEPKAGDPKPSDGQASPAGKPGSPADSKGQGQGKGQDKPSEGKGGEAKGLPSKEGQPSPPQAGSKGAGQPGGEPQPSPPGGQPAPPAQQEPGRKQVQQAIPFQQGSQKDLEASKRDKAGKQQEKAIEELAKAVQELEKRIKQLREEEMLGLLANLEARCGRMLSMQIEVYEATKVIDGAIAKAKGLKSNAEVQKSQQQADKELEIVAEAEKALNLLQTEGSAVAFARVLEEVRQDMVAVQRRLNDTYVGKDTQVIEENVIAMLKEMMSALKKAQQDLQQQQQQPPPPPGSPPKPGDKKLIELVSELKLIRSLQLQVNGRTTGSAGRYKGEQASDPIVRAELQQLAQRQAKLQEMLNKIATGNNQ